MIVKQGGKQVTIVDPKTNNRIELNAGRYELQLAGGGEGLKLSTDSFTLKRGDKTVVTVRHKAPAPASQAGPPTHPEHHRIVVTSPKATDVIVTQRVCLPDPLAASHRGPRPGERVSQGDFGQGGPAL